MQNLAKVGGGGGGGGKQDFQENKTAENIIFFCFQLQ